MMLILKMMPVYGVLRLSLANAMECAFTVSFFVTVQVVGAVLRSEGTG
jgi:hypothetical protein